MNNRYRIIAYLKQYGKTSRLELEQALSIGDVTSRIAEINKAYLRSNGRLLIKATTQYEVITAGKTVPVGYYELDESPASPDLFSTT
jgi:hypothetical protein